MPRLYATLDDLFDTEAAESVGIVAPTGTNVGGTMLRKLRRYYRALRMASMAVDSYCNRDLGFPEPTTLTANTNYGDTTFQVAGVLGYDVSTNIGLLIDVDGSQEFVQGFSWTPDPNTGFYPPFPGTISIVPGTSLQFPHSIGAPVVPYRNHQVFLKQGATDVFDQDWDLTQQGQIAMAHAPKGAAMNVRRAFLRSYPLLDFQGMFLTYPWTSQLEPVTIPDLFLEFESGIVRFPLGYFTPSGSVLLARYRGGYRTMPEKIVEAVVNETIARLARRWFPYGVKSMSSNGVSISTDSLGGLYSEDARDSMGYYKNHAPY